MPARGLGATLVAALGLAVLAVGCAGNDDVEPTGRIVVFGSPEVGLIPASGGKVERLRIGDAFSDAAFSPDGTRVAFSSDPGGITLMTLKDGRTTLVPNQPPRTAS